MLPPPYWKKQYQINYLFQNKVGIVPDDKVDEALVLICFLIIGNHSN